MGRPDIDATLLTAGIAAAERRRAVRDVALVCVIVALAALWLMLEV